LTRKSSIRRILLFLLPLDEHVAVDLAVRRGFPCRAKTVVGDDGDIAGFEKRSRWLEKETL
jgi:hypothetical protein